MNANSLIYGLSCTCHPEKGVRYVGKTIQGAQARLKEHLKRARKPIYPVNKWIAKHGVSNINLAPIEYCEPESLNDREQYWVAELGTFRGENRNGLNANRGGRDMNLTPEQILFYSTRARDDGSNGSVLNWDMVNEIRRRYCETEDSIADIAKDFPVSYKHMTVIVSNKCWYDPDYVYPGLRPRKPRTGRRKLTQDQAKEIRFRFCEMGHTQADIARDYSISRGTVSEIVSNSKYHDPDYVNTRKKNFPGISEEHKAAISAKTKGVKKPEGFSAKLSEANRGEKHPKSKLKEASVMEIIAKFASGVATKAIAEEYSISRTQAYRIKTGERWGHLPR